MNLYKTKTLLAAMQAKPKINTFLKDTFFPKPLTFVTEEVLIDIKKGKRKMAPFVAPRVGGVTMNREGFKTEKYTAPRVAPQRAMTLDDITTRGIGENVFSTRTPEQRQNELLASDIEDLDDSITAREEWLAAQVLFEGKAVLSGYIDHANKNKIEQELDYGFTNIITVAPTDLWSGVDVDIYGSIEEYRLRVLQATGVSPDTLILGRDAYKAFRLNKTIQAQMNNLNMYVGEFKPKLQSDAITYVGKLAGLGIEIYTYDDWYLDDDGTTKPYVPANKILLAKAGAGSFAYGAITQMENGKFVTYEGERIPKNWADNDNDMLMLRLSARPVPVPDDVDGWLVAEVV